jgi:hypothetical protein
VDALEKRGDRRLITLLVGVLGRVGGSCFNGRCGWFDHAVLDSGSSGISCTEFAGS